MPLLNKVKASLHKHFLPPDIHKELDAPEGVVRPKVWIDVVRGEESNDARRIEIELFSDIVPKTAENFRQLCTGECGRSYERATFHRVVPEFSVQGGDIINGDGTGIWSIYGGPFADENFSIPHSAKGLVSMANQGPNTNGCQFFITLAPAEFLNGKHVVFGRVTGGWDVVKKIEAVPLAGERPTEVVGIVGCGGDGPVAGQVPGVPSASDSTLAAGAGQQIPGQQQPVGGQQPGVAGGVAGVAGGQPIPASQQQGAAVAGQQQPGGVAEQGLTGQQQPQAGGAGQQIPTQQQAGSIPGQGVSQQGQQIPPQGQGQQLPQQGLQDQQLPPQGLQGQQQGQIPVQPQQLGAEQQGTLAERFPEPPNAQPAVEGTRPGAA